MEDPQERTEIVGHAESTGQYALRSARVISNNNEVICVKVFGSIVAAIPKMTLWYGEDHDYEALMYEGSDLFVEKLIVGDFNDRLEEMFAKTKSVLRLKSRIPWIQMT